MKAGQPDWLQIVREKVESLRYGVVQIVIHDSRVTLIERTEKTRISNPESPSISDRPDPLEAIQPAKANYRANGDRS